MTLSIRLLAFAVALSTSAAAAAQPTVPRERAPQMPQSIRGHVDRLYSADPRVRAEAACELGSRDVDGAPAIPILIAMLSDDVVVPRIDCETSGWARAQFSISADVRSWMQTSPAKEAAEALGDIGDEAIPALIQALSHSDWKTRKHAAMGLGEADDALSTSKSVIALGERVTDPHPEVRDQAVWALGEIEDAAAIPYLMKVTTDADPRVRANVAWALGEIEHPSCVNPLLTLLKDREASVRSKAAWALGEVEDDAAVNGLAAALSDSAVDVRRQAAWALGEIESPDAIDGLSRGLNDADLEVRRKSAWALGEIEDPRAVNALTRALKDTDWQVRKNAAWALGEIEDPRAISDLQAAARDEHGEVRRAIAHALRELRDRF